VAGNNEDNRLVARVVAGDREAFRILVERHQDRVFGVLLRCVRNRDTAEDLAQEAFVRAYAALPGFRERSSFGTWLIQIALNLVRDARRKQGRRPVVVSLDDLRQRTGQDVDRPDPRPSPDEQLDRRSPDPASRLEAALGRLPEDYRTAFVLKHVEGLSYREISGITGVSVGALKVRTHRARARLRDLCREEPSGGRDHGRPAGSLSRR
jgi:RNA polymerase sigma-70 factor (ECF subfamily)